MKSIYALCATISELMSTQSDVAMMAQQDKQDALTTVEKQAKTGDVQTGGL
jgi:hypothetical protein